MSDRELLAALRRLKVQTGSLACLGCGYEQDCGIHGCAILRETVNLVEPKMTPQEAIGRIRDHMAVHHIGEYPHVKLAEALEMAIKALMNMEKK